MSLVDLFYVAAPIAAIALFWIIDALLTGPAASCREPSVPWNPEDD